MTAIAYPSPFAAPGAPPWGSLASPWTRTGEAKATTIDYIAVILWVGVTTFVMYGFLAPLRYLLAGYFVYSLFRHSRTLLPMAGRNFVFFLIPILCMISALWAPGPSVAFRKGLLLAMTTIAAIFIAGRLHPKQIIKAYFYVGVVAGLMTIAHPGMEYGPATGVFPQKNVLAVNMFFLYVSSIAILFDREEGVWMRLFAGLQLPIAVVFLVLAQSATMLGFTVVVTAAYLGQAIVWAPAKRIPHLRTIMLLVGTVVGGLAAIVVFGILQIDAKDALLEALGKDSSLTGRTYLWEQARQIMHERPWTGMGASGFWIESRGQANSLTAYFHFKRFVVFNFHNSYLELGVALGYPGMYAGILVTTWALFQNLRRWLFDQSLTNFFFIAMGGMVVIHSNTEIDLPTEFSGTLVLLIVSAMAPQRVRRAPELELEAAQPPPQPTPPPTPPARPARSRA